MHQKIYDETSGIGEKTQTGYFDAPHEDQFITGFSMV
jgi:hypothetical protein